MLRHWRYRLALPLAVLFLAQMLIGPAGLQAAAVPAEKVAAPVAVLTPEKPQISLEQAIKIAKTGFEVPQGYTDFSSGFSTYNDRQTWSLRWSNPTGQGGDFSVQVDAVSGEIVNMNYWKYVDSSTGNVPVVPAITKPQAVAIANQLVSRLLPDKVGELVLVPLDNQIIPIGNYGVASYNVQYQRRIKGIPFNGNSVNIQVSGDDGHIISYSLNWTKTNIPEAQGVIGLDKAQQAFAANSMLKLQYWVPAPFKPLAKGENQKARLVYQLVGQNGGAIDAFTGEPVKLGAGEWLAADAMAQSGMGGAEKGAASGANVPAPVLTPEEQNEVNQTAELLSRDGAIAAVERWVEIPADLQLRAANLNLDWHNPRKRIWSFDWNPGDTTTEETTVRYLNARVDARTGELLGLNVAYQNPGKAESALDRAAARRIAEDFLKKVQPQRFAAVSLDEQTNISGKPVPAKGEIQYFSYHRIANGIDFPGNGMSVSVDPVAGKVTNYDLNWPEIDLPGTDGILTQAAANEAFLKVRPLTLTYVQIYSQGMPGAVRLVYLPTVPDRSAPTSNTMDAKTGELLDYQGRLLAQAPKPYVFSDLAGTTGEKEIGLLGQAGLFGDYGNLFKATEKMTLVSLLRAMYLSRFGFWNNTSLTDTDILAKAKEVKWLKEDLQPGAEVSRELLAKLMIRYIFLEKAADLKGIYQVSFRDAASINPDALGYVALATGAGILRVDGDSFGPQTAVTRAEGALSLFKALTWRS